MRGVNGGKCTGCGGVGRGNNAGFNGSCAQSARRAEPSAAFSFFFRPRCFLDLIGFGGRVHVVPLVRFAVADAINLTVSCCVTGA